ncbi:MAG TPA: acyl-CoA synthetase [Mucilaginibacter sp.]|jgi:malonyl-CoA/methylmalonyl-CoA synthetase
MISIIEQAQNFGDKTAIVLNDKTFSYRKLLNSSKTFAHKLLNGRDDLEEERVAFMVDPGFDYVKTLWAIWLAGGVAVPLCLTHPFPSLQYVLDDTLASVLVVSPAYKSILEDYTAARNIRLIETDNTSPVNENHDLPDIDSSRNAMILYTSGTTNKPKGVVSTHANLNAQISTLIDAWEWSADDQTLCVLPLYHVHGIVNVVCCSMWSGATCRFLPSFSAEAIFNIFLEGKLNVFMAVPTIYFKLIAYWESLPANEQHALTDCMKKFRLMVCGSAALPVTVMEKWKHISGQTLLERYGMTEIGMAISNPYNGERKAGYVGLPLPGVAIKLVDEQYAEVAADEPGEILVKGANIFKEYWGKPEATSEAFTTDGWFKTGDIAVVEDGYYRIMGRNSVDIIKSGGYKISALEIEEVLRTHSQVNDCAVVALPDHEWGELIVAAIVANSADIDLKELNSWLRTRIAAYKTPRTYLIVDELPKNVMGKVVKNDVKKMFEDKY